MSRVVELIRPIRAERTIEDTPPTSKMKLYFGKHTPSWEKPGQSKKAWAGLEALGDMTQGWVRIRGMEASDRSLKETYVTMQAADARELALWILAVTANVDKKARA